jgi:hypothetical protein
MQDRITAHHKNLHNGERSMQQEMPSGSSQTGTGKKKIVKLIHQPKKKGRNGHQELSNKYKVTLASFIINQVQISHLLLITETIYS